MRWEDLVRAAGIIAGLSTSEAFVTGCRKDGPPSSEADASSSPGVEDAAAASSSSSGDASTHHARTIEGRADEARRDAGTIDPACEGPAVDLLAAVLDERCAVSDRDWTALARGADAGSGPPLRQEARRDGDRVVVSLVNGAAAPVLVPIRFHPGHSELAFSVLAEDERHAVFELMAPAVAVVAPRVAAPARRSLGALDGSAEPLARVHSARIKLPPGGAAFARITIDARVTKRLDRSCGDAGDCVPPRLPVGRYALHIGQLVAEVEAGPPARVDWDVL